MSALVQWGLGMGATSEGKDGLSSIAACQNPANERGSAVPGGRVVYALVARQSH